MTSTEMNNRDVSLDLESGALKCSAEGTLRKSSKA